jgi:hypothetical protein
MDRQDLPAGEDWLSVSRKLSRPVTASLAEQTIFRVEGSRLFSAVGEPMTYQPRQFSSTAPSGLVLAGAPSKGTNCRARYPTIRRRDGGMAESSY